MTPKELKEDLAYSCNILAQEGHWDNILGHVSVRLPKQDKILMKPHSFGFEEIRPQQGSLPLILFFLPVLFIVILSPAMIKVFGPGGVAGGGGG